MDFPDPDRIAESLWRVLRDRVVRIILAASGVGAVLAVVVVGWTTQPFRLSQGYGPVQPIPYSHKLHAGQLSIPCLYCHVGATKSRHAAVPPLETCMNCHRVTKTDSLVIVQLKKTYDQGLPIVWQRVHSLPSHVFFDHRPHVVDGIACQTCHGEVQEMTVVYQNMSLRMGTCLSCHRNPGHALPKDTKVQRGPENCNSCHR